MHELVGAAPVGRCGDGDRRRRASSPRCEADTTARRPPRARLRGALVPGRCSSHVATDEPRAARSTDRSRPEGLVRPLMRIDVFTIFPDMVSGLRRRRACSARRRSAARSTCACTTCATQATDPHRTVDDAPFGGGAGMVLMAEPVFAAVEAAEPPRPLLYLSPAGRRLDQAVAARAGRHRTASASCAVATRASTSASASTSSTASCRSATTCSAGERWRRWSCSRRSAAWCPG